MGNTFSNNFPKLRLMIPFAELASDAPGSLKQLATDTLVKKTFQNILPRDVEPRNSHPSTRPRDADHVFKNNIRLLGSSIGVNSLVANSID